VPEALDDRVELTDPKAIRALAHPARLVVIDALYDKGVALTATQAAQMAGTTPSAMSYHLRALERFGIVKRAGASDDGRERPWVRAAVNISIRPSAGTGGSSMATAAAASAVLSAAFDVDRERMVSAIERNAGADGRLPLDIVTGYSHTTVVVTPDEAVELMRGIEQLVEPMRVERRKAPPAEAGLLTLAVTAIPDPEHPGTAEVRHRA